MEALNDPDKFVVVQHAPSISVTLGEEFNVQAGKDIVGSLTAALRRLKFDRVFDTAFSADLTIREESAELVDRLQNNGVLPMMTSCSPGWVKFVEEFYPEFIDNLSTCKSPQQMMGAVIKSYFAEKEGIDPANIFSVSIMPCTAKKFEASRPEMARGGLPDIDAVLTTRELSRMIKMSGINMARIKPSKSDTPFGERTTAGKIFGASGGVMEAALRDAHFLVTGIDLKQLEIGALRGMDDLKETTVKIGDIELNVAVANGLGNARKLLEDIKSGLKKLHFIEVMTCPGGCINGGGQPIDVDKSAVLARMQCLYKLDRSENIRTSHSNKSIQRLYDEFLGAPLQKKSHELLHTHYVKRDVVV